MGDRLYNILVYILMAVGGGGALLLVIEMMGFGNVSMGGAGAFSVAASGLTMLIVALQFAQNRG